MFQATFRASVRRAAASMAVRTDVAKRTSAAFAACRPSSMVMRPFSSSFAEPNPTLFFSANAAAPAAGERKQEGDDAQLRSDVRVMGSILGKVIQEHVGSNIFEIVEQARALAKEWRGDGMADTPKALAEYCAKLSNEELYHVSRAFTHFLALANAAESHHRIRRLKRSAATSTQSAGALFPKPDSCGGVLPQLLDEGHSADVIFDALTTQTTELVLTAHPTEVNRRTILDKNRRIQHILTEADDLRSKGGVSAYDQRRLDEALYREISGIWLSEELSRKKPTPETEAEKNTLVLETVIWNALPNYLRKLDATCSEFLGKRLPLDAAPIKFASWMGGDRDGNPNVRAETTREVCLQNRRKAATLFHADLRELEGFLSITTCSDELRSIVGDDAREPYRAMLRAMGHKMKLTAEWASQELDYLHNQHDHKYTHKQTIIGEDEIYLSKAEFEDELMLIHRSLVQTGNEVTADGKLTDVLRNLSAFGLTLIPLDVRQESDRHEEAVDAITRFLGLGQYSQWDEATKISWLVQQISSERPLLREGVWNDHPDIFSDTAVDTLETFRMIADQHEGSLGAYVISQATSASDVLAVLLLQLDAGVKNPLRVSPLFETLDDLNGAADTMRTLFSLPTYMGIIKGRQEVMIGYSDSAKDAGRLAAVWAQYETQEVLANVAKEYGVDMTFFHGKGGTVGRGGNPQTFLAIMAHAPGTINGHFRVTEQGEMINQNLGYPDRAERTMDIFTAAVLAEKLTERSSIPESWRKMMDKLSEISCAEYRHIVRGDERFVPYFRSATPEQEFGSLNIGSRPAKRKATGGVESLRAIPWIFAWNQVRSNLPVWAGIAKAFRTTLDGDEKDAALLREMYQDWDSFRTMVDLVEMVLAKSEPTIAQHYDEVLVEDAKARELGAEVRRKHLDTERAILDLTGHETLGANNKILTRALKVRNPYVDCLNVLQAETLLRFRKEEAAGDKLLSDALLTTITGIANGMGNTG